MRDSSRIRRYFMHLVCENDGGLAAPLAMIVLHDIALPRPFPTLLTKR